jgi:hypothetical protein
MRAEDPRGVAGVSVIVDYQGIRIYPPTQKTSGVSPGMNASDGPAVALAEAGS